jgi:tight adherence protein B
VIAVVWFALALGSALLGATAIALYLQGRKRAAQDEMLGRLQLGPMADDGTSAAAQPVIPESNPLLRAICRQLWRAGYEPDPGLVIAAMAGGVVVAALLVVSAGWLLGGMTAVVLVAAGWLVLHQLGLRWHRDVATALPGALEHVMRALLAGNTLEESFAAAGRETPEPLCALLEGIARQVRLGAPIEDALAQVASKHDLPDFQMLAMAARVNRRYGGSIRNMLRSVVQVIRQRESAARELRALTSETRQSARWLAIIPIGITVFILYRNPVYYDAMWGDTIGRFLLVGAFLWQLAGMLVIWRLARSVDSR